MSGTGAGSAAAVTGHPQVAAAYMQPHALPTGAWNIAPLILEALEVDMLQAKYIDCIIVCHKPRDIIVVVWAHGEACSTAAVDLGNINAAHRFTEIVAGFGFFCVLLLQVHVEL
jgi:hypothetical protein